MSLVEIGNLGIRLGGNTVLNDVDMHVGPGEIITIVGPNGSGKTTLLRAIIGAIKPSMGWVKKSAGLRIGLCPPAPAYRRNTSYNRTAFPQPATLSF